MYLKRFLSAHEVGYAFSMTLYEDNFIREERRDAALHERLLAEPEFFCCAVMDTVQVGIAFFWESENFLYLEHLCIAPELRGSGYGTKILELLRDRGKQIILEIEPAVDERTSKRKHFYEKNGFFYNGYRHIQPKYHVGDDDLILWVMSDGRELSRDEYDVFYAFLKEKVEIKE